MNKPDKITTNQLIKQLTADTIDRAYLISALEHYSKQILATPDDDFKKSLWNHTLWKICAQNTLDTLNKYGGERS